MNPSIMLYNFNDNEFAESYLTFCFKKKLYRILNGFFNSSFLCVIKKTLILFFMTLGFVKKVEWHNDANMQFMFMKRKRARNRMKKRAHAVCN